MVDIINTIFGNNIADYEFFAYAIATVVLILFITALCSFFFEIFRSIGGFK